MSPVARMTYAEYVASEVTSPVKLEFIQGQVYARSGGTPEHGALATAVIFESREALRGNRCRVHSSDLRIRISDTDTVTYPDASVICGSLEISSAEANAAINPKRLLAVPSACNSRLRGPRRSVHRVDQTFCPLGEGPESQLPHRCRSARL